ncbi:sulfatase-like hydrolase/transferase [Halogranum rubrum]|nr:sulfatase-like hydrolase/transferase [Halogranum salarium]
MTRNVVLVCLDTVRKDFFDDYAPRLRARADVSFEQCRAASAWSTPSHASMFTGRLPHQHGVHTHALDFTALDREDTLLGDLPDHRSVGVSANVYAGSAYGFDTLFDDFCDVSRYHRFPDGLDPSAFIREHGEQGVETYLELLRQIRDSNSPLKSLANVALFRANDLVRHGPLDDWPELFDDGANVVLREAEKRFDDGERPFVGFLNLMDGHEPHRVTRGYDDSLHDVPTTWTTEAFDNGDVVADPEAFEADLDNYRALYGTAVDYLDRKVTRFIDRVQAETDRETTFVITADHGENLGTETDEGLFGHLASLSEGVLHVPLCIVNAPDGYLETVDEYVSHLRLRELVVGLAADETPDVTADRIPAEVVGLTPNNADVFERDPDHWDRMIRCVYDGETKTVWDSEGGVDVYDLDSARPCWQSRRERSENHDETPTVPDWAHDLFDVDVETYKRAAKADDHERSVDDDARGRLEDLGYL